MIALGDFTREKMSLDYNDNRPENQADAAFNTKIQQISWVLAEHVDNKEDKNKILNAILANTRMDPKLLDDVLKVIKTCCQRKVDLLEHFCPRPSNAINYTDIKPHQGQRFSI